MQEEVNKKVFALIIKSPKLTSSVLREAMKMYLNHRKNKKQNTHGKTTVKKLVGEGNGASTIEINEGNIKDFERVAKKYNIDFAVKKDKTAEPPKYIIFFKAKDSDVLAQAFKEYVFQNEKKKDKVSIKEKLLHFKEIVKNRNKNKERQREKVSRGMSADE